jgi:hypothetical protein
MKTAYLQWITLPVSISSYCFVCTQANSGSVYCNILLELVFLGTQDRHFRGILLKLSA